jgi:hypothetical protein
MNSRKTLQIAVLLSLPIVFLGLTAESGGRSTLTAVPPQAGGAPHCLMVGGSISTNLGVIDANTTLGPATGDLRGALAANILGISQVGNNTLFSVQHHWVTESGETLTIDKTTATSTQVAPGLFAIINYPLHISSGTGKFAGATGDLQLIGEVNLNVGNAVFRYTGQVCFADKD